MGKKSRWFVITNWNLECKYQEMVNAGQIKFVAVGEEICPKTGKQHHQVFCYFHNPHSTGKLSIARIGKMWGPCHCYAAPVKGTMEQNVAYCSKEGHYTEYGEKPKQGCRTDLEAVAADIIGEISSVDEIAVENPMMFHQYGRTLDRLEGIALRKRCRTTMTEGIWFCGPSGSGKSHHAFEGYTPETHYVKNLNEEWWDGYKGQKIVIFNEFRGQISFSELLDLCDKWPKTVKWRCRESVPFLAETIIVTSIKNPRDCYLNALLDDEPWGQFERRFKIVELASRSTRLLASSLRSLTQKCPEGNIGPLGSPKGPKACDELLQSRSRAIEADSPQFLAYEGSSDVESLLDVNFS